jgi:hypothetical protein
VSADRDAHGDHSGDGAPHSGAISSPVDVPAPEHEHSNGQERETAQNDGGEQRGSGELREFPLKASLPTRTRTSLSNRERTSNWCSHLLPC